MTHCQKILDALQDGQWHSTAQLYRDCGPMILHSRISDLRHKGHTVEGRHVPHKTGAEGYEYRLVLEATKVRQEVDQASPGTTVPPAEQPTLFPTTQPHYDL